MYASQIPATFPIPFANSAGSPYIRPVPTPSQIGITDGAASLADGFPPLNFTPIQSGGVPPFGQDMNGILNQITANLRWIQAGGLAQYNATFSTVIGGYPLGAVLVKAAGGGFWQSTTDNNVTNPDTGGAGWVSMAGSGGGSGGTFLTVSGTDTLVATPTPAVGGYSPGQVYSFVTTGANVGSSVTLNISGLGAVPIHKMGSVALSAGDLISGAMIVVEFDGASFQVTGGLSMASSGGVPIGSIQYFPVETPVQTLTDPAGSVWLRTGSAILYNPTLHGQINALGLVRTDNVHGFVPVSQAGRFWYGNAMYYSYTLPGGDGVRFLLSGVGGSQSSYTDLTFFSNSLPQVIGGSQNVSQPCYYRGWMIFAVTNALGLSLWATKDGNTFNKFTFSISLYAGYAFAPLVAANGSSMMVVYQGSSGSYVAANIDFEPTVPSAGTPIPSVTSASPLTLVAGPDGIMILDQAVSYPRFYGNDNQSTTSITSPSLGSSCNDAVYNPTNGLWVITTINGQIMSGTIVGGFTVRTSPLLTGSYPYLYNVASGLIAAGTGSTPTGAYSPDGVTWTAIAGTTSVTGSNVSVGDNFIQTGLGTLVYGSTSQYTSDNYFADVAYFNSKYVYAGGFNSGVVFTSSSADSSTFDFVPSAYQTGTTKVYSILRVANSNILAIGNALTMATSSDAVTWTQRTVSGAVAGAQPTDCVYFGGNYYVSCTVPTGSNNVFYSPNLSSWTGEAATSTAMAVNALATNGTTLVAAGATQLRYSTNGTTWTTCTGGPAGATALFYDSTNTRYVAVLSPNVAALGGQSHACYTSPDGITWTAQTAINTYPLDTIITRIFKSGSIYYAISTGTLATDLVMQSASALFTSPTIWNTEMPESFFGHSGPSGITGAGPGANIGEVVELNAGMSWSINGAYSSIIGTKMRMTYQGSIGFLRVQ